MTQNSRPDEFTERSYRALIETAAERYSFEPFGTAASGPHVLWRHDVDVSVHRALRLAEIEAEAGVRATYFLWLHGWFYNLLERHVVERAREILERGHWLGLHFDLGFYDGLDGDVDLAGRLSDERRLLEDLLGHPVNAFSYHHPDVGDPLRFDDDEIAGMVNAYGRTLRDRYTYVSDSNGYWRFRPLPELLAEGSEERLQVLTHPEWWQEEQMPPRQRVQRAIDGRSDYVGRLYESELERTGRENVQ